MLNSWRKNVEMSGWSLERARLQAQPYRFQRLTARLGSRALSKIQSQEFFRKLLSRFCPFAFTLALLSLFMVEDNSISLVPAFVPACGCQRTR
jgi:hypothetical protein